MCAFRCLRKASGLKVLSDSNILVRNYLFLNSYYKGSRFSQCFILSTSHHCSLPIIHFYCNMYRENRISCCKLIFWVNTKCVQCSSKKIKNFSIICFPRQAENKLKEEEMRAQRYLEICKGSNSKVAVSPFIVRSTWNSERAGPNFIALLSTNICLAWNFYLDKNRITKFQFIAYIAC